MTVSAITRADAAFHEQVHAQWRDWRGYLSAHLTLLEAQSVDRQWAFERTDALEEQVSEAQRRLATLPAAQRALFDGLREERRQQAQVAAELAAAQANGTGRAPDPDIVERDVLTALLAEAEGIAEGPDRIPGRGDVPLLVDGAVQWYRVDVQALRNAPGAAAYAAAGSDRLDMRRRIIIAGLVAALTILFLIVWFLWPRGAGPRVMPGDPTVRVNGDPVLVWPVQAIQLTSGTGPAVDVMLDVTRDAAWRSEQSLTRGQWRAASVLPLRVCVPAPALQHATGARLPGIGGLPDRVYVLSATRGPTADLIIEPCPGDRTSASLRYGTLRATEPVPAAAFDEPTTLADGTQLTVRQPAIIGPGSDPTLPAGTAQVVVTIVSEPRDWPAYAPTLLLASGESLQTPDITARPDGAELRYLIPLPTDALDIAWDLTPPGAGSLTRWRATLAPPADRAAVLHEAVAVPRVAVRSTGAGLVLTIAVENRSPTALLLTRDDITLSQAGRPLAVPDLASLRQPLAPGEVRELELELPSQTLSSPLTLVLGASRYEIAR